MKFLSKIVLGLWTLFVLIAIYDFVPYKVITKDIEPQYNEVMEIVQNHCGKKDYYQPRQIYVHLGDLKESTTGLIGYCAYRYQNFQITFDEQFWKSASDELRFELMAHELTHCLFGLGHNENDPTNYMYPSLNKYNQLDQEHTTQQFLEVLESECSQG